MLQERVWAERALSNPEPDLSQATPISEILLSLALDLPASTPSPEGVGASVTSTSGLSRLDALLRSPAFRHLYAHAATREPYRSSFEPVTSGRIRWYPRPKRDIVNPTLCRLHLLLPPNLEVDVRRRALLRLLVYSSENFTPANDRGPFHLDGRVNWALLDAAGTVMRESVCPTVVGGLLSYRADDG